jgi:hypothetical protein
MHHKQITRVDLLLNLQQPLIIFLSPEHINGVRLIDVCLILVGASIRHQGTRRNSLVLSELVCGRV